MWLGSKNPDGVSLSLQDRVFQKKHRLAFGGAHGETGRRLPASRQAPVGEASDPQTTLRRHQRSELCTHSYTVPSRNSFLPFPWARSLFFKETGKTICESTHPWSEFSF